MIPLCFRDALLRFRNLFFRHTQPTLALLEPRCKPAPTAALLPSLKSSLLSPFLTILFGSPAPMTVPPLLSTSGTFPLDTSGVNSIPRSRLSAISCVLFFSFSVPWTPAPAGTDFTARPRRCLRLDLLSVEVDGSFDRELVGEANSEGTVPLCSSYMVVSVGAAPGGVRGAVAGLIRMKP